VKPERARGFGERICGRIALADWRMSMRRSDKSAIMGKEIGIGASAC